MRIPMKIIQYLCGRPSLTEMKHSATGRLQFNSLMNTASYYLTVWTRARPWFRTCAGNNIRHSGYASIVSEVDIEKAKRVIEVERKSSLRSFENAFFRVYGSYTEYMWLIVMLQHSESPWPVIPLEVSSCRS